MIKRQTEGSSQIDEVRDYIARLYELGHLLSQLDTQREPIGQAIELKAARDVLHDAVYGALLDVGESIAVACNPPWRDGPMEAVPGLAAEVIDLDAAVRRISEPS